MIKENSGEHAMARDKSHKWNYPRKEMTRRGWSSFPTKVPLVSDSPGRIHTVINRCELISRVSPLFKLSRSEIKFPIHHPQMLLVSKPLD